MSNETVLKIPRFCFEGITVYDNDTQSDVIEVGGFNCSHLDSVADELEQAAETLRKLARAEGRQ